MKKQILKDDSDEASDSKEGEVQQLYCQKEDEAAAAAGAFKLDDDDDEDDNYSEDQFNSIDQKDN